MALPSKNLAATELEFGKLRRVSAEECEAALLLSVAERIKAGASSAELAHWRKSMFTVEIQFECLPTADQLYFRAVNIRRSVIVQNEALVRSAMQQIQHCFHSCWSAGFVAGQQCYCCWTAAMLSNALQHCFHSCWSAGFVAGQQRFCCWTAAMLNNAVQHCFHSYWSAAFVAGQEPCLRACGSSGFVAGFGQ